MAPVDPDTSIAFPETITVPAKIAYPPLTLLGVGVRTVSFLRVKVYSIGFYADLTNPNLKFTSAMSPEEKIQHIIDNTSCVLRIVPTRPTSYSHLRDAFVRALQGRMLQGPISQLKSMFPNTNLNKHVPLDVFLTPPAQGKSRAIVIRDMGAVQNDWVSTQLFRYYFDGAGPSPPLKRTVVETLSQP
ncbi:chalcone isomerase [Flagelloscypha sp. PMI_526]|nr:chalcone isomerase [Flagelloscypha sp. PMI_526]